MNIEEKRRELFEAFIKSEWPRTSMDRCGIECGPTIVGQYKVFEVQCCWKAWQAALDAVVIVLPSDPNEEFCDRRAAIDGCRAAIESTGLGLRVLP